MLTHFGKIKTKPTLVTGTQETRNYKNGNNHPPLPLLPKIRLDLLDTHTASNKLFKQE